MDKIYVSCDRTCEQWIITDLTQRLALQFQLVYSRQFELGQFEERSITKSEWLGPISDCTGTIVIIGERTASSVVVDHEIHETLNRQKGLIAFSNPGIIHSKASVPKRMTDNLDSGSGYSMWHKFPDSGRLAVWLVKVACNADRRKIRNGRALSQWNNNNTG